MGRGELTGSGKDAVAARDFPEEAHPPQGDPSWGEDDARWDRVFSAREHDYDPRWDYELRLDQFGCREHRLAQRRLDELAGRDDTPFERGRVYPADLSESGAVGVYCAGTYNEPVILIDVDAHQQADDPLAEIFRTVEHEAVHAVQESDWEGEGEWADEEEAEEHRFV